MTFRLVPKEEAHLFDNFMAGTPNGHIFQSFAWGEVKKPQWEPLRVIMEEEGRIVAAASILKRKIPMTGKCLFYLPRGPVLHDWQNKELFQAFLGHLIDLAKAHGAILIKIDPCLTVEQQETVKMLQAGGFMPTKEKYHFGGLQPRYTFRLDLSGSVDDIMNRFPKKIRYKMRYGEKKGLTFKEMGEEGIPDLMKVLEDTKDRGDFVIRGSFYYKKVYKALAPSDCVNLLIGYYEGQPIVAGITFAFGDKSWGIYGGQSNDYRNLYAYHALIWERIKWAKSKGAKCYDFFGVPREVEEDSPLFGLYYFKKSFGGEFYSFVGEKDLVLSPFYYYLWTRLLPLYRKILIKMTKRFRKNSATPKYGEMAESG